MDRHGLLFLCKDRPKTLKEIPKENDKKDLKIEKKINPIDFNKEFANLISNPSAL